MTITDTDLHDKIKTFITKLDRMESRVKEVEAVAAKIPKLEATLSRISSRVETVESRGESMTSSPQEAFEESASMSKRGALMSGMAIGFFIVGIMVLAWMLGFI